MREYRAKRLDNGQWVYGCIWHKNFKQKWLIRHVDVNTQMATDYEVDPKTIGQRIGREDKHGNAIYEGHVVKCVNGHIGVVVWVEHDCCFNVSGYYSSYDDYTTMAFMEGGPFEILGNAS